MYIYMNPQEADIIATENEDIEDMGIFILSDECEAIQTVVTAFKYGCCIVIGVIGFVIFRQFIDIRSHQNTDKGYADIL